MENKETAESRSGVIERQIVVAEEAVVKVENVCSEKIERVEKSLIEHPVRDFKNEQKVDVYKSYVGFIEIHLTGSSLSKSTTLSIPDELVELGLEENLRSQLSETMRIDLSKNVELGAQEVNKRVDAFREIFTRQMGQPLGRIYKKSDWKTMKTKRDEINVLVANANTRILKYLDSAANKVIEDAAEIWFDAIKTRSPSSNYTKERVNILLRKQWYKKKRTTRLKFEMFTKDLTWETLKDESIRRRIEEEFPDIRKIGLYKKMSAWGEY